MLFVAEPVHFIQTKDEVWIIWQRDHHVRRILMNKQHSADPKPSWFGESVGRYENGELVIDTIGLIEHEYSFLDNYTPHTKDLHVVERWKIVDGGDALEATVMVEDPGTEWVCAENNLGYEQLFQLDDYPMPVADKPDF